MATFQELTEFLSDSRLDRLEVFLKATTEAHRGRFSLEDIKAIAADHFADMWDKFKEWETLNYSGD